MKLGELAGKIDKSQSSWVDMPLLAKAVGITGDVSFDDPDTRLTCYPTHPVNSSWEKATYLYFLDDQLVAVGTVDGHDERIKLVEPYHVTHDILWAHLSERTVDDVANSIELDEDVGDGYVLRYADHIITNNAFHEGREVIITHQYGDISHRNECPNIEFITLPDRGPSEFTIKFCDTGETKLVTLSQLQFPFNLT